MKNKSLYIVFASSLLILFVLAYQGSFAYFTANVTDNRGEAGGTTLTAADLKDLTLLNGGIEGEDSWIPGTSKEFDFYIKNPSSLALCVKLIWKDVQNTWVNTEDLVFTLTDAKGTEIVSETPFPTDSDTVLINSLQVPANGETPNNYKVKVTYKNTKENQYEDMSASFSAKIEGQLTECASNPGGGGVVDPPSNPSPFPEEVLASVDTPDDAGNGLFTVTPDLEGWTEPELRYAGVNYVDDNTPYVHNYVTFNNEKAGWRIIGLVNVLVIQPDGSKQVEQRLKIIRDKPESKAWDSGSKNDWTKASLMKDFNEAGGEFYQTLTEDAMKMIDDSIIWNLGGISSSDSQSLKANEFYKKERGTEVYQDRPTEWPKPEGETYTAGKALVGLMYPSDYGYGVGGASRDTCLTTALYDYNYNNTCADNDWLFLEDLKDWEWLLSPDSSYSADAFTVNSSGDVGNNDVNDSDAVRPVVYLTSKVKISGGTGEHGNPYTLEAE